MSSNTITDAGWVWRSVLMKSRSAYSARCMPSMNVRSGATPPKCTRGSARAKNSSLEARTSCRSHASSRRMVKNGSTPIERVRDRLMLAPALIPISRYVRGSRQPCSCSSSSWRRTARRYHWARRRPTHRLAGVRSPRIARHSGGLLDDDVELSPPELQGGMLECFRPGLIEEGGETACSSEVLASDGGMGRDQPDRVRADGGERLEGNDLLVRQVAVEPFGAIALAHPVLGHHRRDQQ